MFKERKSVEEIEEGKYLSPKFDEKGLIPVSQIMSLLMKLWIQRLESAP